MKKATQGAWEYCYTREGTGRVGVDVALTPKPPSPEWELVSAAIVSTTVVFWWKRRKS